ncbi:phage tail assembly protein, partial [Pseudomonas sp. MWU12-2534b]
MSWMPPKHDLLSPISGDDGAQIEQIQLKPLFYAAQKEALERAGDDEDDQFFELALLATGLSVKELDQLKRPDYVSIAQYVHE